MSNLSLAIYRIPTARSTQVGQVRVVVDRNHRVYINGSKVITATPNGDFMVLTLADEHVYYVKAQDYTQLLAKR